MGYAMRKIDLKGEVYSSSISALLDTGSQVTIINNEVARELEMAGLGNVPLVAPLGESMTGWHAFATLRVVGTPYTNRQKIIVLNKMVFSLDSLVGMDFFSTVKITSGHTKLEIKCDKCGAVLDECDCTWMPFKYSQ
jgi:predicted aspartyl protease